MKTWNSVRVALAALVLAGLAGQARTDVVEQVQLSPVTISTNDCFGCCVSVSGDVATVGAYGDDDYGPQSGRAYVFFRDNGGADNWGQQARLAGSGIVGGDQFGWSASVSGDCVVVGTPGDDDKGANAGCAYIFMRQAGGTYGQVTRLLPADLAAYDNFGISVAINDDIAVVGAYHDDDMGIDAGAAYIFGRDVGGTDNWGQIKKLYASDGAGGDLFGNAVGVHDDFIVVGAPNDDSRGPDSGTAYVFGRDTGGAGNWGQAARLIPSDGAAYDYFGCSVSYDAGHVAVGALGDDDRGLSAGSSYVFDRDYGGLDNWGQKKKLLPDWAHSGCCFGCGVAVCGELDACGAKSDNDQATGAGADYVFDQDTGGAGNWGQLAKVYASNPTANACFGCAVALDDRIICVGADMGCTGGCVNSGAAYMYHAPEPAAMALIGLGGMGLLMKRRKR